MNKQLQKALTKPAPKVGRVTEDLRPSRPYQPRLTDKQREIIGLWKDIDEKSSKGWGPGGVAITENKTPHADFLTFEYLVKNYRDDMQAEVQKQVQSGDDFKSSNEVVKPRQIRTS